MYLKIDKILIFALFLLAIIAVRPMEVLVIRDLFGLSTTKLYLLFIILIFFHSFYRKDILFLIFKLLAILSFFCLTKIFRIKYFIETSFHELEIAFLFFFIIIIYLREIKDTILIEKLLKYFVLLTTLLVLFALFQSSNENITFNVRINSFNHPFTPHGLNKNSFSLILLSASVCCVILFKTSKDKFLYFFLFLGFTILILYLESRSHLPLITATWIWFLWKKNKLNNLFIIFSIILCLYLLINLIPEYYFIQRPSDTTRLTMMEFSLSKFLENPFFGYGSKLFYEQIRIFKTTDHNLFTLYTAYFGVWGLVMLIYLHYYILKSYLQIGILMGISMSISLLIAIYFTPFIYHFSFVIPLIGTELIKKSQNKILHS